MSARRKKTTRPQDWRKVSSFIPATDRQRVGDELKRAYEAGHTTSGRVLVKSLAFSSDPRKWHITAIPANGEEYLQALDQQSMHAVVTRFYRADVHLHAVLSPEWLRHPWHHFVINHDEERKHEVIAGTRELEPPDDADRLELLCLTMTHGTLATRTNYAFRYTKGPVTVTVGDTLMTTLSQLRLALPVAHKQFHAALAARVAARLIPKPDKPKEKTIAEWAQCHSQALADLKKLSVALNTTAKSFGTVAKSFRSRSRTPKSRIQPPP